jgi:hypothetical protein
MKKTKKGKGKLPNPPARRIETQAAHQSATFQSSGRAHVAKWVKTILLVITALASSLIAYIEYKRYLREIDEAKMVVAVYRVEGGSEVYYASGRVALKLEESERNSGVVDYELPLKLINEGKKDADGITVWVKAENAELLYAESDKNGKEGWRSEQYAGETWGIIDIDKQSPNSGIKLHGVRLRVREDMDEVKLLWRVHPFNIEPTKDTITICLKCQD